MITPANLPFFQFFSANKTPLAGGKLHSYLAGTDTPTDTYTDYTGSTKHQNPITLDTLGTANVWVDSGVAYKFVLKSAAGATLKTWDGINNYSQLYTNSDEIQGAGSSDDLTAEVQAKLDALGTAGGGILRVYGIVYLASDINVPDQVHIVGAAPSVGGNLNAPFDANDISNAIYLSDTATINCGAGTTIKDIFIVNKNLVDAMPFADSGAGISAVNAFSGTAIEATGKQDVYLTNLRIMGFAQAISTENCGRFDAEWIEIDCTAGILIDNTRSTNRIVNVHCYPFVAYAHAFFADIIYRSGAAFKTTTFFDGGIIENCQAYGYAIGYDIQCSQNVKISNCACDDYGEVGSTNVGHIGYKISGTANHCMLVHCGASSKDIGLFIDASNGRVNIDSCQFWGNETGVKVDACIATTFTGTHFMYLNSEWAPSYQLHIDGAGKINVHGCTFYGNGNDYDGIFVDNHSSLIVVQDCMFAASATCMTYSATCTGPSIISGNYMGDSTAGFSFLSDQARSLADLSNNGFVPGTTRSEDRLAYNGTASGWKSFGSGSGNVHANYLSGGTTAAQTAPSTNQTIGAYYFYGWDGAAFGLASGIRCQTSATNAYASGSTPGALVFSTTPNASATSVDRVAISQDGHFYPTTDNAYTCGSASLKWSAVYATNGTIQTSNESDKTDIQDTPLGLAFIEKIRPVSCKFKTGGYDPDAEDPTILKARKGVRTHHLLLAQDVKKAADEAGVDFAGWGLADKDDPNSDQWLNYSQFIAPLISAVKELSSKIKQLEEKRK
jgi:hypothetical protein